jgi:16S rRNA G1207 methylase RsmC
MPHSFLSASGFSYNGSMTDLAALVNKTVPFKFRGAELNLDLSHALFSSFEVDAGTRLLLKAVGRDEVLLGAKRILDAGSGVGVIGLAMAAAFPECQVEARDRDLLACAFTDRNRKRNKVKNLEVFPGLLSVSTPGLLPSGHPSDRYDYILTNIPAKAGGPVLEAFFLGAPSLLSPGGRLAVVIVNPLMDAARGWIAKAGFSVMGEERGANHHVFVCALRADGVSMAGPSAPAGAQQSSGKPADDAMVHPWPEEIHSHALDFSGLDLGLYLRSRGRFKLAGLEYQAAGIWGLPEFDTVGYGNVAAAELAVRVLPGSLVRDALIVGPGLGHLAIWAAKRLSPERLVAASRDLLSLAATGANLAVQPAPSPAYLALSSLVLDELPPASFDFIAWNPDIVPEYDWMGPLWAEAGRLLKKGGTLIVHCPPTELTRLSKRKPEGFRLLGDKKKKTFIASAWLRV